jgi:hypothetical protein
MDKLPAAMAAWESSSKLHAINQVAQRDARRLDLVRGRRINRSVPRR